MLRLRRSLRSHGDGRAAGVQEKQAEGQEKRLHGLRGEVFPHLADRCRRLQGTFHPHHHHHDHDHGFHHGYIRNDHHRRGRGRHLLTCLERRCADILQAVRDQQQKAGNRGNSDGGVSPEAGGEGQEMAGAIKRRGGGSERYSHGHYLTSLPLVPPKPWLKLSLSLRPSALAYGMKLH